MYGENSLGYMYQNGLGVRQDYNEALKWYRKSANQGYRHARDNMKKVKRLMAR